MNWSSSLRVQGELKYTSNQHPTHNAAILGFLKLVAEDTNIAADFSQVWEILEFKLGDDLTSYGISHNYLYLVCTGKVRLLGFDATLKRFVSTQVLVANQVFGADDFFCNQSLQYRAIASSAGLIAYISLNNLKPWLSKIPKIKDYLSQITTERQKLIFLKTATELRSQKSENLRKLLPYLKQTKINAGSSLIEATPAQKGRFWLQSGDICSSANTQPPVVGESWGYPHLTEPTLTAQTDLLLYHLPVENWELAVGNSPQLFPKCVIRTSSDIPTQHSQVKTLELLINSSHPESYQVGLVDIQSQTQKLDNTDRGNNELQSKQETNREKQKKSFSLSQLWRRYPFIQQHNSSDCGAACLAMISRYWGKRFSLNTLSNLAGIDSRGASLEGLAKAAQTLGYDTLLVQASLSKLTLQTSPWIAHWQGIHYIVVWEIKGDRVLISDPAIGKKSLSRSEFVANWTSYAVILQPTERWETIESEKISYSVYWEALRNSPHIIKILIASLVLQALGLGTPILLQLFIDEALTQPSDLTLNVFSYAFLFLGIWQIATFTVRQHLLDSFANHLDSTLIGNFINHALELPLQFFASRKVEDIISLVQENRKIQQFVTRQAVNAIISALSAFVYLGLMANYNLPLTLLVSGLILPIFILNLGANPYLRRVSREIVISSAAQNSLMEEAFAGITTVKVAAAENSLSKRIQEHLKKTLQVRFGGQKFTLKLQLISNLLKHLGTVAVLWCGGNLAIAGQMSIGEFVAFNMLAANVVTLLLALVGVWDEFQEVRNSCDRLDDVVGFETEENAQKSLLVMPSIQGEVHFQNVSFAYNDSQSDILQNISFQIKPKQTIGIVGAKNSGKSTLVNLLSGLIKANSGRITIDGHDIADVGVESLRCQLGVVPQECFLFSGTILENITLFDSQFTVEMAIASAKLAEAHAFIQGLHDGYNTQLGRGLQLNREQRQKIAIARALVRNPRILILDEAINFLDAESQRRFQQNLALFNCTTLIVTHRLNTLCNADCILVLDRGILVEQGTHEQLMAIHGLYYHLTQQQLHL